MIKHLTSKLLVRILEKVVDGYSDCGVDACRGPDDERLLVRILEKVVDGYGAVKIAIVAEIGI
jgi:hypothetical protein